MPLQLKPNKGIGGVARAAAHSHHHAHQDLEEAHLETSVDLVEIDESHNHNAAQLHAAAQLVGFEEHTHLVNEAFTALQKAQRVDALVQVLPLFMGRNQIDDLTSVDDDDEGDSEEMLRNMFDMWDMDASGALSASELMIVFDKLSIHVTPKQCMRMIREGAVGATGAHGELEIDFAQFRGLVYKKMRNVTDDAVGGRVTDRLLPRHWLRRLGCGSDDRTETKTCWPSASRRYAKIAWVSSQVVSHPWFDRFIMLCIVMVGVGTALTLSYAGQEMPRGVVRALAVQSDVTLFVFTIECGLKLVACGEWPLQYVIDPDEGWFNAFDFCIVAASLVFRFLLDGSGSIVTVGRLLRLVKIALKVPELKFVLIGFVAGANAVVPIMTLLFLIMYVYGAMGRELFGENDPKHFGTVPVSMLSLFKCSTLSGWLEIYQVNAFGCAAHPKYRPANETELIHTQFGSFYDSTCTSSIENPYSAAVFFYSFTLVTSFVVLSLFISVM